MPCEVMGILGQVPGKPPQEGQSWKKNMAGEGSYELGLLIVRAPHPFNSLVKVRH